MSSDDVLLPGALARVASALACTEAPLVYGDALWIDEAGRVLRPKRELDFDWGMFAYGYCYLPQPSTFFRRSAYLEAGGMDPTLVCCMDFDLWHRLARPGRVVHIEAFLSGLRSHPATKTQQMGEVFRKDHEILRGRYLKCSHLHYRAIHLWHRARRVARRWRTGCYRPLTDDEQHAVEKPSARGP